MFKLIAIDLDGTLLNDQHEIPEDVKYTLQEAKNQGIKIVPCSGRPINGMHRYIEELNLVEEGDYAIAFNGALTQENQSNKAVATTFLQYDDLIKLHNLSMELNTSMHFFDSNLNLYTPNQSISEYTVLEAYLSKVPLHFRQINEIPKNITIPKIMFVDEPEKLDEAIDAMPESLKTEYTVVKSAPYFLEFVHSKVSKGNAVKNLAEQLRIKQEEVMTIGDNGNDLSMIKYAGCGVAMENAIPELKAAADFQTRSNNDSGVAYAIEKLVLNPLKEEIK